MNGFVEQCFISKVLYSEMENKKDRQVNSTDAVSCTVGPNRESNEQSEMLYPVMFLPVTELSFQMYYSF